MLLLSLAFFINSANSLPAPDGRSCGQSVCFSGSFSHNAVLQQAPQRASLYGASGTNYTVGSPMTLKLEGTGPTGAHYNKTWSTVSGADGTWKVLLDAMPAWGNFTATIFCPTCLGGETSASIHSLTFGDVIVCGGQSNQWIPMVSALERNSTYQLLKSGRYNNLFTFVQGDYANSGVPEAWILPEAESDDCWNSPNPTPAGMVHWCPVLPLVYAPSPNRNQVGSYSAADFIPAVCLYTGIALTDAIVAAGQVPPPIGLFANPQGGTTIEAWIPLEITQSSGCKNATCLCSWPTPGWTNCPIYMNPLNSSCKNGHQ